MQTTGRSNYRAAGHEADPEALEQPDVAANSAARFWQDHGLDDRAQGQMGRRAFDGVTRTINRGQIGAEDRWQAYQRALTALGRP